MPGFVDPEWCELDTRRKCNIIDPETGGLESGYFHMWFIPDSWPRALVELENGRMISVSYRRIIFVINELEENE